TSGTSGSAPGCRCSTWTNCASCWSTPGACACRRRFRRNPSMARAYDRPMPLRAIDFHVHLPTPDWLDGSMAGYLEAAEAYFRSSVTRQSLEELAAFYRGLE